MMRFKIAFRNVFRNTRRTLLNVFMLAGGVSAIVLFRGFCDHLLHDLREITLKSQTGHMQIATKSFWEKDQERPKDALVPNYESILQQLRSVPGVKLATGRLSFFGLIGTSEKTYSARGVTVDPLIEREKLSSFRVTQGAIPNGDAKGQVFLGSGLAQRLKVKAGENITVLSYTYDNVVNALDLEVAAVISTELSEFDDTTFFIPLKTAQTLLDTDKVDQIVVWLDRTEMTESVVPQVRKLLKAAYPTLVVKDWTVLAEYYQKCVKFFATQNRIIEFIVVLLVLLGVLNTVGMSVMERTGEIGTVRALGENEGRVMKQFLTEGAILGVIGATTGTLLGTVCGYAISAARIPIEIPGASKTITVGILIHGIAYRDAVALVVLATLTASLIPAYRASKIKIVDALRHAL